ncbi:hypothetical protein ZIOFF_011551 [Zingiber officinale]|uniref:Uncharacterized protein n=1 Tax=Zingiber officinale TaxID=94328 RepID=A0A8J5M1A9_ZINOF|nr:hypothetical protein ZIOFF_011551 [Zingiber officinale]
MNSTDPSPDPETFTCSYQLEVLEKAKKENTIIFLETGSGKTLIAVMLLRSYAFTIRKPSQHIAVFLVPTIILVTQMDVDFWDTDTWKENLEEFEVHFPFAVMILSGLVALCFLFFRIIMYVWLRKGGEAKTVASCQHSWVAWNVPEYVYSELFEWDAMMPSNFALENQLHTARQELGHALYQL